MERKTQDKNLWKKILDFHFNKGDKVLVVNKKLSCYGVRGIVYEVHYDNDGEDFYYALKVTRREQRRIYPQGEPNGEDLIWTWFMDDDLELRK